MTVQGNRLKPISPGTPQWDAWLAHYRGTKTYDRMLVCLADARPFLAIAEWPPDMPRAERLTRLQRQPDAKSLAAVARASVPEGAIDQIAHRLEAKQNRDDAQRKANKQRNKHVARVENTLDRAREAALAGNVPTINDTDVFGTVVVDDPDDRVRRVKITSLKDDPIGQMHRRGQLLTEDEKQKRVPQIVADARLAAARRWQALYERAEIGGARAIDPAKEPVDGGRFVEPDADSGISARDQLRALRPKLGMIEFTGSSQRITGERLLIWVLGEKKTLGKVAEMIGIDRRHLRLGHDLVATLDKAALGLKITMRAGRAPERPRDKHDDAADRYLRSFQQFTAADSESRGRS